MSKGRNNIINVLDRLNISDYKSAKELDDDYEVQKWFKVANYNIAK